MKIRAAFFIGLLFIALLAFEGWVMLDRFWLPVSVTSTEAVLLGRTMPIKTPFAGTVNAIHVRAGQGVVRGSVIAVIAPSYPDMNFGDLIVVTTMGSGVVSSVRVTEGEFVQASELIAVVEEMNAEDMHVAATFALHPDVLEKIHDVSDVAVSAVFLNDGRPVPARLASVLPLYDAEKSSVSARVEFTAPARSSVPNYSGLPVAVTFTMENPSWQRSFVQNALRSILPNSFAAPASP